MPTIDDTLMATLTQRTGPPRERAFRELVRRHAAALAGVVRCVVPDPGTVDDVVQDTFLRVYQARERYEPGRAAFQAWLFTIGRNLAIDVRRKQVRRHTRSFESTEEAIDSGPGPDASLAEQRRAAEVRAAVDDLPEDDRAVVLLRYDADLSYEDIAEVLGATATAVKQRIYRARQRLRARLEDAE